MTVSITDFVSNTILYRPQSKVFIGQIFQFWPVLVACVTVAFEPITGGELPNSFRICSFREDWTVIFGNHFSFLDGSNCSDHNVFSVKIPARKKGNL